MTPFLINPYSVGLDILRKGQASVGVNMVLSVLDWSLSDNRINPSLKK
tara:strand:+ start:496 stop:639 length:144 start_codon:yes stop_codon:yes gene_type:complete